MLGCQDFCGYYDWTFHFLRRHISANAAHQLWATAMADAQQHYTQAGLDQGLRGLYDVWVATGEDEHCDWTFTLDEEKNVLRWDMRQCPSKGHLIENDLNADEDYCDHCMGWIAPVLEKVGGKVVAHEHNHCGQCWSEMKIEGKPSTSLAGLDVDITQDPRWQRGFIERWENSCKLPVLKEADQTIDPAELLQSWFASYDHLTILGRGPSAGDDWTKTQTTDAVIVTDPTYVTGDVYQGQPVGVLIGDHSKKLEQVAKRFHATAKEKRPLLMHMYLPKAPMQAFGDYDLPRPVPILPLLIRKKLYKHTPHAAYPTTGVFAMLLAGALDKDVTVAGIDLYQHPCGQMYHNQPATQAWPKQHSQACDRKHIQMALDALGHKATVHPLLQQLMA